MADKAPKCKRIKLETNNEAIAESQQIDGKAEDVEAADTKPNITTIFYDCLERILEYLDMESLLSVAGTCKRLEIGAANYFGEKFGNSMILVGNLKHSR